MKRIAVLGSSATIAGWGAISLSPRSCRSAQHRVRRRPDYPATFGLDPTVSTLSDSSCQLLMKVQANSVSGSTRYRMRRCCRSLDSSTDSLTSLTADECMRAIIKGDDFFVIDITSTTISSWSGSQTATPQDCGTTRKGASVDEMPKSNYEIYNERFRRWHRRVAHEQLIFSHWDSDKPITIFDPGSHSIHHSIQTPEKTRQRGLPVSRRSVRDCCSRPGYNDNNWPEYLFENARDLAHAITMVNGQALFVKDTAHSICREIQCRMPLGQEVIGLDQRVLWPITRRSSPCRLSRAATSSDPT